MKKRNSEKVELEKNKKGDANHIVVEEDDENGDEDDVVEGQGPALPKELLKQVALQEQRYR
jgi:hypothetical protein